MSLHDNDVDRFSGGEDLFGLRFINVIIGGHSMECRHSCPGEHSLVEKCGYNVHRPLQRSVDWPQIASDHSSEKVWERNFLKSSSWMTVGIRRTAIVLLSKFFGSRCSYSCDSNAVSEVIDQHETPIAIHEKSKEPKQMTIFRQSISFFEIFVPKRRHVNVSLSERHTYICYIHTYHTYIIVKKLK